VAAVVIVIPACSLSAACEYASTTVVADLCLWTSSGLPFSPHLYERRSGLLYLFPGLHAADPFPDAFDDRRMSGDCFYSIGQDVKIDKTFPDERGSEVLVFSSNLTSLAKTQSCGSRHNPRPGAVLGVS
jgi:hypothetical protein